MPPYRVLVYFNDTLGGSFARGHKPDSDQRLARYRDGDRPEHIPMLDGYRDGDILEPSRLNPLSIEAKSAEEAAETAFWLLNADARPNGQEERSLSVGDVLLIDCYGERTCLQVDILGMSKVQLR